MHWVCHSPERQVIKPNTDLDLRFRHPLKCSALLVSGSVHPEEQHSGRAMEPSIETPRSPTRLADSPHVTFVACVWPDHR